MINYEPLKIENWKELKDVATKAWLHTYKNIYSEDFIKRFINDNYSEKATRNAIKWAKTHNGYSIVARDGNKIIGYLTIGVDEGKNNDWRLYRIYLLPDYIGKGVGKQMLKLGEDFLIKNKAPVYFLFVHKDNRLGKNFYLRNRFKHVEKYDKGNEWYLEKKI